MIHNSEKPALSQAAIDHVRPDIPALMRGIKNGSGARPDDGRPTWIITRILRQRRSPTPTPTHTVCVGVTFCSRECGVHQENSQPLQPFPKCVIDSRINHTSLLIGNLSTRSNKARLGFDPTKIKRVARGDFQ